MCLCVRDLAKVKLLFNHVEIGNLIVFLVPTSTIVLTISAHII